MKILECKKVNGQWRALVLMVTGGICLFVADYIEVLMQDIEETNNQLKEMM